MRRLNESVYALYEPAAEATPDVEIVFLHGLCEQKSFEEAHIETWTTVDSSTGKDICWPEKWLGEEFPNGRMLSVSYNSSVNRRKTEGTLDLYCIAENLIQDLTNSAGKVGQTEKCPLILVGQDMGGFIVKAICLKAHGEHRSPECQAFMENVKGVFYYGTPHQGVENMPSQFNSPLAQMLTIYNADTSRLNNDFRKLRNGVERQWKAKAIGVPPLTVQGLFHKSPMNLPEASTRFDVDAYYTAVAGEMQSICKPKSKESIGYYYLANFVKDIVAQGSKASSISLPAYKRARIEGPSLGFRRDKRYVRLQRTEEQVRKALTQPGDPKLVLLYGGPGKGKSCLARDIALHIEPSDSEDDTSPQQSDLAASSSTRPNQLAKAFDTVVYLECGAEAQISTVRLDLQQKLGRGAHALGDKRVQIESHSQTMLRSLLQNKKILIIFDDVWKSNIHIVNDIIKDCGKGVKCLVTSQIADLCRPLNCSRQAILMEKIDFSTARKILASHILGLEEGISDEACNIPKHLEGFADVIIDKVDANPLAMACAATAIDPENFQDERVWRKLEEDLSDSLNSEDMAMIHNSGYPYSFWAAMQLSVNGLTEEQKNLFILVSSCRGPSVPEEVIEYFQKLLRVKGSSTSQGFLKAKKQIEGRQLIQIREGSWSIHSLLQEFVNGKLEADKRKIKSYLKELSKNNGKEEIVKSDQNVDNATMKAVISLYLDDRDFTQEAALPVDATMNALSAVDQRRSVIEPVPRLLLSDIRGIQKPTPHSHVFLTYMKAGSIHEDAAITLLRSSNSKCIVAMTDVLILFAEAAINNNIVRPITLGDGLFYALLGLLGDKGLYKTIYSIPQNDLLSRIAEAVYYVHKLNNTKHGKAFDLTDTTLLTYFTSALEEISAAMVMHDNRHLQLQALGVISELSQIPVSGLQKKMATTRMLGELSKMLNRGGDRWGSAATIFGNLSERGGQPVCQEIVSTPTALEGLVSALGRDGFYLHYGAARTLANLAGKGGQDLCARISNVPTALENLVCALEMGTNPYFQAQAARALGNLVHHGAKDIALKISCIPEALERHVRALTKASNPGLQQCTGGALASLAQKADQEDLCIRISNVSAALEALLSALEMDTNPIFQSGAARLLGYLLDKGGESIALKILCIPESLETLLRALTKASNPALQLDAGGALATLARQGSQDLCARIANFPTALEDLVCALEMDTNPDFQAQAAQLLRNLVCKGGESIALKVSSVPESLERLIRALTKASNPQLQAQAASALSDLAWEGGQDICARISNDPTALEDLVCALEMDGNPQFQAQAARALCNLVSKNAESIVLKISCIPESLERLVRALTKASNPLLQLTAAGALANLAGQGGQDLCARISNVPTALEVLVCALEMDTNPDFQAQAARALRNLGDKGGESIALKISCIPESLGRLVRALTKASNPLLQQNAAGALANLAWQGSQDLCARISNLPTALEDLVCALEMDTNPDFQAHAARALGSLAKYGGGTIVSKILNIPKSSERLVHALTKVSNPGLQKWAKYALDQLVIRSG